jgi:hypothetical protein
MDITTKQIKTILHALEVAVQKYEELLRVAQHHAESMRSYTNASGFLAERYEAAASDCDVQIMELKNLASSLSTRYRQECEKLEEGV